MYELNHMLNARSTGRLILNLNGQYFVLWLVIIITFVKHKLSTLYYLKSKPVKTVVVFYTK